MRKATAVSVLTVALVALTGCNTVRQVLNIDNPTYRLRDFRPRVSVALPLSASTIDFDFTLEIDNPNPVGLNLDRVDFDMFVNGTNVARGLTSNSVRIPANGVGDVRIRTRVNYDNLKTLFREIADVIQGERANYELRGRAFYDTPLGRMDFPLTIYRSGSERD
jgi:LEA14-like dessication related protein